MLWAGSELLSRPSEASLKGCLDSGSVPALFILRRAKRATPQLRSPYPQILLLNPRFIVIDSLLLIWPNRATILAVPPLLSGLGTYKEVC